MTPNLFDVAGIQAFRGRTFLPDEGLQGKDDVGDRDAVVDAR